MIDWSQRAFLLGVVAVSSLHECEWRGKRGQIVFFNIYFYVFMSVAVPGVSCGTQDL